MFSTLTFSTDKRFPPRLEEAYQADLAGEKRRVARHTSILCSVLYLAFGILDIWAVPSALFEVWAIRVLIVVLTAVIYFLTRRSPEFFVRNYTAITVTEYLIWGSGIEVIILLSHPADIGWSAYYAGLILVSMALYSWTYLRHLYACAVGLVLALGYIWLAVGKQKMTLQDEVAVLVTNCFFLISANIIGLFSLHIRERFSRKAYLLKNALRMDLETEEEARRQSDYISEHDALTGLPNRVRFMRKLGEMLARPVAVLFIDLDGFKPVNDTYGHAAGDAVLKAVGQRMRECIRTSDLAARLGGDEFVVALPLPEEHDMGVERIMEALLHELSQPIEAGGVTVRIGASVGVAQSRGEVLSAEELLARADQHMYEVKRARKSEAEGRASRLRAVP
ncbi:GGDEF domain-containing protein [Massilia endophytica]|uniref:GGDEF domain-containing protein n=1 Tax=Massilia endophytica TaxID=2899220 RepID=UPI001E6156B0|nr:GGDEF domain-containing protein [Massilia endophytica]UGQ48101.1 GGDEF domain-containing protein [Massilia endophytica]